MATETFDIGDQPRVTGRFTSLEGIPADPTSITVTVLKPDGTFDEPDYDETDMTNPSIGTWQFVLPYALDQEGIWTVKMYGTGDVVVAEEISWRVSCGRIA